MSNATQDVVDPAEKFSQEELPMIQEKALKRQPTEYGWAESNEDNELPLQVAEGDVIVRINQNDQIKYQLVLETYLDEMVVYDLENKQYAPYSEGFLIEDTITDIYEIKICTDPWGLRAEFDQE